ncbi:MAG: hypothetical protein PHW82_08440 [Bacteroidales bacterium]|nr:hypothetical protein [Bacteroidales bacterium]
MKLAKNLTKITKTVTVVLFGILISCCGNINEDNKNVETLCCFFSDNIGKENLMIYKSFPLTVKNDYFITYDYIVKFPKQGKTKSLHFGVKGNCLYILNTLFNTDDFCEIPILNFLNTNEKFQLNSNPCCPFNPLLLMETEVINVEYLASDTIYFIKNTLRYAELQIEEGHISHEEVRIIMFSPKNGVSGLFSNETGEDDFNWPY